PNAAGAFCALRIEYADGTDEIITTDSSWQVSETVPTGTRPNRWNLDELNWLPAVPVHVASWKTATDKRIGETLARASAGSDQFVRASLLKADDLMRALGRPNRDQIVTSRPSELTTLEAVNLATSEELVHDFEDGAKKLLERVGSEALIDEIYLTTLTRLPSEAERQLLTDTMGPNPDPAAVADLLWAITMMPEFFMVR
ncbi:MAG: DUF1553 domain-containing protein, partial [Verrucomicrobiota bacterium]